MAVSPMAKMKPGGYPHLTLANHAALTIDTAGVNDYLKEKAVLAYEFDVDCQGTDNCQLRPEFLGYPDPRPHRTFANIRYALYEYWLQHYSAQSYVLILDFRDTFFQVEAR